MTTSTTMTDRELDWFLAEHLFGADEWCTAGADCMYDLVPGDRHWHSDDHYEGQHARMYSSTGDGMLLVLEAMRERGWAASFMMMPTIDWLVIFHSEDANPEARNAFRPRAVAEGAYSALSAP